MSYTIRRRRRRRRRRKRTRRTRTRRTRTRTRIVLLLLLLQIIIIIIIIIIFIKNNKNNNNYNGIYMTLNLIHTKQCKALTLTQSLIQNTRYSYKNPWLDDEPTTMGLRRWRRI